MNFFLHKLKRSLPIYLIFLVSAVFFDFYFILSGSYFVENCCDSLKQISFFTVFLERFFNEGFHMWSWNYGIGVDVFGQFIYYYTTSPFYWIIFLITSIQNLQDIFEIRLWISIGKLLLTMIFMFHLLKYFKRSIPSSMIGSLIYGGSTYFLFHSLRYDFLVDGMVFLPLLLWGFEKYVREEKKGLFIFSVFLTVCSNFYLAFMNSLFLGLFMIFSYLYHGRTFALKDISLYVLRFVGVYFIGLLLASFSFLPAVYNFTQVDRFFYEHQIPVLFSAKFYSAFPYELFFMTSKYQVVVAFTGICFFVLISAVLVRKYVSVYLFTLVLLVMMLFPFFYSMFNGFSSIQFRWLYLIVFVIAFSSSFALDHVKSINKRQWFIIGLIGLVALSTTIVRKHEILGIYAKDYDIVILFIAVVTILLLALYSYFPKKIFSTLLIGVIIFNLSYSNYFMFQNFLGEPEAFANRQQVLLGESNYGLPEEQMIFDDLRTKDSSFYRTVWDGQKEINAPLLYGYNGMSVYNSMLDGNVHRFFKRDMNTLQQNAPSMFKNADNRIFIESLLNTKYYVNNVDNGYSPFGYQPISEVGELAVHENQLMLPIGFVFPSYITKDQFDALSIAQKDEILLSAVIVEESVSLPKFDLHELDAYTEKISFDDLKMENATLNGHTLTVKPYNSIIIPISPPQGDGEVKVEVGVKQQDGGKFIMTANEKTFSYNGDNNIYSYPQNKVVFNLMNTIHDNEIKLGLTPGNYDLNEINIHFNQYAQLEHLVRERQTQSLEHVELKKDSIRGDITLKEDGILFMSIPYSKGWHVKVDGKNVEPLKVQGTFIGIQMEKGFHNVEMSFRSPYLLVGFILSLLTCIGIFINYILRKKNKRNVKL